MLAKVAVSGSNHHRISFEGSDKFVAVLDQPGPLTEVPAGTYRTVWGVLKDGPAEAMANCPGPVVLKEGATWKAPFGGPLTNTVTVSGSDGYLRLSHKVAGAGGLAYQMLRQPRQAPTFDIFQGDKRLITGQFQFG